MTFSKLNVRVSISVLTLSLSACTGDFSLNSEQIQEIVKNNPGREFDAIMPGCTGFDLGSPPVYVVQIKNKETDSQTDQSLIEMGYEVNISGDYRDYFYKPKCGDKSLLSFVDPKDINSIEVLRDADSVSKYGAEEYNGVVIIRMKKGTAPKLIPSE